MIGDQHERAMPIQLTGWEIDTIIQSLEATIDNNDDHQFGRDVRNLVLELARQLTEYLESS